MSTTPWNVSEAPAIAVDQLPGSAVDAKHPVWWGNTLLLTIETMTVALLVVTYYYVQRNFESWPPPRVTVDRPMLHPFPDWTVGTINLVVMLAACVVTAVFDRAGRKRLRDAPAVVVDPSPQKPEPRAERPVPRQPSRFLTFVLVAFALSVLSIVLRFYEFPAMKFRWDDNVYGSVVWSMLVIHLTYLGMSAVELGLLAWWVWTRGLSIKFASDATLAAASWYWTAGAWVVFYLVIYVSPHLR